MKMLEDEEFYVGYLSATPPRTARRVRSVVIATFVGGLMLALLLALLPRASEVATFEFGAPRALEGFISREPYPLLWLERPGRLDAADAWSPILLVGQGKHGFDLAGPSGRAAALQGTLIYRDDLQMAEVVPDSLRLGDEQRALPVAKSLGWRIFQGEIVDSKCHLGVMKPGSGRVHKECALLCLRGGVPPLLVLRRNDQAIAHVVLIGSDGRALGREVLDAVAEPVEVKGELLEQNGLFWLKTEPATLKRVVSSATPFATSIRHRKASCPKL